MKKQRTIRELRREAHGEDWQGYIRASMAERRYPGSTGYFVRVVEVLWRLPRTRGEYATPSLVFERILDLLMEVGAAYVVGALSAQGDDWHLVDAVSGAAADARANFNERTLPWLHDHMKWVDAMADSMTDELVEDVLMIFALQEMHARVRLGSGVLRQPEDYPVDVRRTPPEDLPPFLRNAPQPPKR